MPNRLHPWALGLTLVAGMLLAACQSLSSDDASTESAAASQASAEGLYQPQPNEAVIYYKRTDGDYDGWGLHLWDGDDRTNGINELTVGTSWDQPFPPTGIDPNYGAYYVIPMTTPDWGDFMFIVHKGNDKDVGGVDHRFNRNVLNTQQLFTFAGVSKLYTEPHLVPPIAIDGASAHWLDANTLAFNPGQVPMVKLFVSDDAELKTDAVAKAMSGGEGYELRRKPLSDELKAEFPHLADWIGWEVPADLNTQDALKSQLVVATFNRDGELEAATQVQTPGVLDSLYAEAAYELDYGANLTANGTRFRVWAPTAQEVSLLLYKQPGAKPKTKKMTWEAESGSWVTEQKKVSAGQYYRYQITTYHHDSSQIETLEVTDPYSLSLSTNSEYSQVVDLNAPELQPKGWNNPVDFAVDQPEQIVIYESHIRDFTLSDRSGSPETNGKYGAFLEPQRESMQHLAALKEAGLTHMHLLPSFDIATTIEFADQQANIDDTLEHLCRINPQVAQSPFANLCDSGFTIRQALAQMPADSEQQQAFMAFVRPLDNFNWGYDPYHYTVPEGSYAQNAEGSARILEYRQMVQALHDMDLNVVMDVVYNHTNQSGLAEKSVLDKVVPGYYHRRNPISGAVENSTCCKNTATEHRMMEKLMIDSLIVWARDYHIDAFRFDLMGHHMKAEMERALAAVQAVRPHVYFYGEGWNFGEVQDGARGDNAIQWTMAGTGVGTFSDRLRDAVRGGGPFDERDDLRRTQGFGNGLYYLPNEMREGDDTDRLDLLHKADQIRVGLAGNLRNFVLEDHRGFPVFGQDVDYNGQPAGYTLDPQENISYVSKHDNQTLWDNNQYRIANYVTTEERVRMQVLGLATNMMVQGVPFFHMGSDLLRSKSMERDSYDSGDWFNAVDFSLQDSTWARGLPREDKDGNNWYLIQQAFANPETYTEQSDREFARDRFQDYLALRSESPLLHLATEQAVKQRVDFHNTGPNQIPGVIVMSIDDGQGLVDRDPAADAFVVVINASDVTQAVTVNGVSADDTFELHPRLANSTDDLVRRSQFANGEFRVPGLTVAVFRKPQLGSQGEGVPVVAKDLTQRPPLGRMGLHLLGTVTNWEANGDQTELGYQGKGVYARTLELDRGFYKLKVSTEDNTDWGQLGAFLKPGSTAELASPGGVMNLQLAEAGLYQISVDFSEATMPVLTITPIN